MRPFEVKGDHPEWELIYDQLVTMRVGEVITYEELDELLGRDFLGNRSPITKANSRLQKSHHRTLVNERCIGYRIAEPTEHVPIAGRHHGRARRQLGRSRAVLASTDRSLLTQQERERVDMLESRVTDQELALKRMDGRVTRVEQAVTESNARRRQQDRTVEETAEKLSRLTDSLRRAGFPVDQ